VSGAWVSGSPLWGPGCDESAFGTFFCDLVEDTRFALSSSLLYSSNVQKTITNGPRLGPPASAPAPAAAAVRRGLALAVLVR